MSDGLISVSSPPQSRSSSAQDSYSTSATQYDDPIDGIATKAATESSKRQSKLDGKGNVIVSVRVRPDASGQDRKTEGEWMVDGRKSLIGYRGKEGGDYYYGTNQCSSNFLILLANYIAQIMFSRLTMTTQEYMIT